MEVQQINNRVYMKKQRYMLALKEINIIKTQIEKEIINGELDKSYSEEITDIYNRLIISLLEEGVKYRYVKDAENASKDIIRIMIDGVNYECKNTDIKEILKDSYDKVMNFEYDGPSVKEIQESKKNIHQDVTEMLKDIKESINNGPKKKQEAPKIDYVPPKVVLNGKDKKLLHKDRFIDKIIKLLGSLIVTIIILLAAWVIYKTVPGLEDKVTSGFKDFTKQISSEFTETEEETEAEKETININVISETIIENQK